jgi:large subunit ribosomal protein L3
VITDIVCRGVTDNLCGETYRRKMKMKKGIIGRKVGMTQIFDEKGNVIPVTVIEATPNVVAQVKTIENDGYNAVQLGYGEVKDKHINKPEAGHFAKAKLANKKHLREFKLDSIEGIKVGDEVKANIFAAGEKVDVQGTSKGKGFQGVIKRHGQSRGPMGHGSMYHRRPGSMGSTSTPGRVFKGKKLPGQMGKVTVTIQNLDVVKVDMDKNVILLKGSVPGPKGAILKVKSAVKATK